MYTEEWQSMADFEGAGDRYRKWISEWEKQRAWREIHTLEDGGFFLLALWVEIAVSRVPLDLNEASKADTLVKLWTTSHAPCTAWSHRKTWWRVKQIFPLNVSSENSLETISIFALIPKTEKSSNPLMRFSVYEYANVELLYPPPSPDWLLWSKLDNTALWSKTLFIS